MPGIALPIRLYERRGGYSGHTPETTLSGLNVRLEENKRENIEQDFPDSSTISVLGQRMNIQIFVFKRGKDKTYTKDDGIIFTINGQTHGCLPKRFFKRNSVGMEYLADSLLVLVDCTNIDGRSREDLFMNSRDRLSSCELRSAIEKNLEHLIGNHPGLRKLRNRRRGEDIENKLADSKPLAEVIEKILRSSPTLANLFVKGIRLPDPYNLKGVKAKNEYEGKKFPTFFKLTKEFPRDNPKTVPINTSFRIQYKTDASNDYLLRDSNPGEFSLESKDGDIKYDYSLNLWNGTGNLNIRLPNGIKEGDILRIDSTLLDISKVYPIREHFYVQVVESVKRIPK